MWTIADAEKNLDRIFTLAVRKGSQKITDGEDTVVLISRSDFDRPRAEQDAAQKAED